MHIGRGGRGHLPPLHLGDFPVRKQNKKIRPLPPRKGLDRRAARVARCGAHDGGPLAAPGQHMVHQP